MKYIFRGMDVNTSEWIYGSLIDAGNGGQLFILPTPTCTSRPTCQQLMTTEMKQVDAETVGQWTGLKDSKNIQIFKGDIVDSWADIADEDYIRVVEQSEEEPCLQFNPLTGYTLCAGNESRLRVIGNIHENKKLSGVK